MQVAHRHMVVAARSGNRPAVSTIACALTPVRHLGCMCRKVWYNAWPDAAVSTMFVCRLEGVHLFAATPSKLLPLARFTPRPSPPALSNLAMCYITHVASSKASYSLSLPDTSPRAAAHYARASNAMKSPLGPPWQSNSHSSPLSGTSLEAAPF